MANAEKARAPNEAESTGLKPEHKDFCLYYVKYRNKTKAYQKAYGCSLKNAQAHSYELWKNVEIRKEIDRLLEEFRDEVKVDIKDLFQWHLDIVNADITDFVKFGSKTIEDPETKQKFKVSYVNIKDSKKVDGTLINEVSKGRDGVKVKLIDKAKSLQWLSEHIDIASDKQKAELDLIKAQVNKITGNNQEVEDLAEIEDEVYGSD